MYLLFLLAHWKSSNTLNMTLWLEAKGMTRLRLRSNHPVVPYEVACEGCWVILSGIPIRKEGTDQCNVNEATMLALVGSSCRRYLSGHGGSDVCIGDVARCSNHGGRALGWHSLDHDTNRRPTLLPRGKQRLVCPLARIVKKKPWCFFFTLDSRWWNSSEILFLTADIKNAAIPRVIEKC